MSLSLDEFLTRLEGSSLLQRDEVQALLDQLPAAEQPGDGTELARLLVKLHKLTSFQAQVIHAGKGQSLVLGNYVITDKLGQGGMGWVFKAEHRRMSRIVALKVLSPAVVKTPEAVQRFHREVKAAARLEHQNIVTAYDADEARGTHFMVMQFVAGTDLNELVKS